MGFLMCGIDFGSLFAVEAVLCCWMLWQKVNVDNLDRLHHVIVRMCYDWVRRTRAIVRMRKKREISINFNLGVYFKNFDNFLTHTQCFNVVFVFIYLRLLWRVLQIKTLLRCAR